MERLREGDGLAPDAGEQAALATAIRLDREGASFRSIGRALTEMGAQPHRGEVWHASSVRAMLRSKMTAVA